jgi:sugar phosphate isomerase/epimerase
MNRRRFIQSGSGCVLGLALGQLPAWAKKSTPRIPVGFQLYTVRGEFAHDVPGTLKQLGQIGYQGVEFWGYAGTPKVFQHYSAEDLRPMLDDAGLKCCGMHLELKALDPDRIAQTIESSRTLGSQYLNVAAAQAKMGSAASITELANQLNEAARQCRSHKMIVGYHAHPFDFARIDGRFAWELLFERLNPKINMQMDVGNCLGGNGDPIAMLKKFPGRTHTIHIKEHEDKTFASDFYREVFHLCETTSKTKWYIVEMGGNDGMGLDIPREALAKLKKLGPHKSTV